MLTLNTTLPKLLRLSIEKPFVFSIFARFAIPCVRKIFGNFNKIEGMCLNVLVSIGALAQFLYIFSPHSLTDKTVVS